MWNVKAKATPVILWTIGNTSKLFRHYLSNILGKYEIKELYNETTILGTAHTHTHYGKYQRKSTQHISRAK
jgi:hypothetical protein